MELCCSGCDRCISHIFGSGGGGEQHDDEPLGQRVALLKQLEARSGTLYREQLAASEPDADRRAQVERVVFASDMSGVEEFSTRWFELIRAKMERMKLCREHIERALGDGGGGLGDDSGFDAFERALVVGCCRISGPYDGYYLAYLAAVQEPSLARRLAESPPDPAAHPACYSHYTAVQWHEGEEEEEEEEGEGGEGGRYTATPFASFFAEALAPVLAEFDALLAALRAVPATAAAAKDSERAAYVDFFAHYRTCLSADRPFGELEALWRELDVKWMDTKGDIQVVHDIETGYGDPLRVKATPDFSLRFLDSSSYAPQNATIRSIQGHMEEYFGERGTPLARDGLGALASTLAGIYYIPFKTGIALQFSFSGQSIPNRIDVKNEKGVKIYFDPAETVARVELGKGLVAKVFADAGGVLAKYRPDAVEQLVWHVAAHEVGHAIYNLKTVEAQLTAKGGAKVVTLLEEPRAELTAMFTLQLLHWKNVLDLDHLKQAVAHFALDALRYFAKYESEPLKPYIIFQRYAYKTYFAHGYLTQDAATGELTLHDEKTLDVLEAFAERFLAILDCEDRADADSLVGFLEEMEVETDFVRDVVKRVAS
jgi:hypothetical protein